MSIEIRDFVARDRGEYIAMSGEFFSTDAVLHPIPAVHLEATFDACMEKSPYLRGFALLQDGAFAGYALISLTWSNEAGGLCVLLEEAYIAPRYQGHGLGSAFLRFVEEEYPAAKRFRLEVTRVNIEAVRLYKRFGYEEYDYLQMVKDV